MAIVNGYATLPQLKATLNVDNADDLDDGLLERAIETSSRQIDQWCDRYFWDSGSATARVFAAWDGEVVWIDDYSTETGLVVKTDTSGDGTYNITWASTDYQSEPLNGVVSGLTGWAYSRLRAIGSYTFPVGKEALVQVTAQWGWASVPTAVEQACLIQASKVYHTRYTPQGLVAMEDGSAFFEPGKLDARARSMLEAYRRPVPPL